MFSNRPAQVTRTGSLAGTTEATEASSGLNSPSGDVYHIRDRVQRKLLADTEEK